MHTRSMAAIFFSMLLCQSLLVGLEEKPVIQGATLTHKRDAVQEMLVTSVESGISPSDSFQTLLDKWGDVTLEDIEESFCPLVQLIQDKTTDPVLRAEAFNAYHLLDLLYYLRQYSPDLTAWQREDKSFQNVLSEEMGYLKNPQSSKVSLTGLEIMSAALKDPSHLTQEGVTMIKEFASLCYLPMLNEVLESQTYWGMVVRPNEEKLREAIGLLNKVMLVDMPDVKEIERVYDLVKGAW